MNVIINDLLVNYTREGSGDTILMLHGWADQLHTFDTLAGYLASNYEVIRLDLAGFGGSQAPAEAWGLDEYADYVKDFITKLGIRPTALVGHSNGGAVSIKAVANGHIQPDFLVLLSSAGIRSDGNLRKSALKIFTKTGKLAAKVLPSSTQSKLRKKLYSSVGSDMTVAPHMEATFKRIVGQDIQADAARITIPTLIVNGTEDEATPPKYGELFNHLIAESKLVPIEGADHFAHQSHAQEVATYIEGLLKK